MRDAPDPVAAAMASMTYLRSEVLTPLNVAIAGAEGDQPPPGSESGTETTDGDGGRPRRKRRKRARSPCVECNEVPEDALEASKYKWCEDVSGKLCEDCGSFCERCMETRLRNRVMSFHVPAHDGAYSTCEVCCGSEDDDGPFPDEEDVSDEEWWWDGKESDQEETYEEGREEAAGATLVCAMRRSVFFENATGKLHAVDAVFGKKAVAEFAADFGSG